MFISYAQNFEDVMLWRALKDVKGGFYIDIGAAWPELDSVTNAFYELGWSGINVEPNPKLHNLLSKNRIRDINLPVAVGSHNGEVTISIFDNPGLSTIVESYAAQHLETGYDLNNIEVPMVTLSQIWEKHVPRNQPVHFLKIDIEGGEKDAIRGANWERDRPWIVLVEATLPMSNIEAHESWEYLLLNYDYKFAYADGLNRFYVASEQAELLSFFKYPPNVFDNFLVKSHYDALNNSAKLRGQLLEAQGQISQKSKELSNVYQSKSWKVTAPLRYFLEIVQKTISKIRRIYVLLCSGIQSFLASVVRTVLNFSQSDPRLLSFLLGVFNRFPWLKARITKIAGFDSSKSVTDSQPVIAKDLTLLSPIGRQVYIDLQSQIKRESGEKI